MKKDIQENSNRKKASVALFITYTIDYKAKVILCNGEYHSVLIKGKVQ